MPPRPRYSLQAFLAAARSALAAPAAQRPNPLTLVVGNESADLDSLCSAVLLAYFRSHQPPQTLHVPLSNLPRADLRLRPELQAVLGPHVSLQDLITLDDLPDDLTAAGSRWLLVDHNALTGDLAQRFAASVVGCIDHHVDEGVVPHLEEPAPPRVIERCGSCASLVVRASADAWRALSAQQPDAATDAALARLALAPILVDTSALQAASKTADVDRWAVGVAERHLQSNAEVSTAAAAAAATAAAAGTATYDRARFYDDLARRKNDIAALTLDEILRKDYKQWHETAAADGTPLTLGMATVVQGVGYLVDHVGSRAALLQGLRTWADERSLDLAVVMTVQHDDAVGFARQLLLWAVTEPAVAAAQAFAAAQAERLGLQPWGDGQLDDTTTAGQWRRCWQQTRTEFSRKQVAPYLREAMRSCGRERNGIQV